MRVIVVAALRAGGVLAHTALCEGCALYRPTTGDTWEAFACRADFRTLCCALLATPLPPIDSNGAAIGFHFHTPLL